MIGLLSGYQSGHFFEWFELCFQSIPHACQQARIEWFLSPGHSNLLMLCVLIGSKTDWWHHDLFTRLLGSCSTNFTQLQLYICPLLLQRSNSTVWTMGSITLKKKVLQTCARRDQAGSAKAGELIASLSFLFSAQTPTFALFFYLSCLSLNLLCFRDNAHLPWTVCSGPLATTSVRCFSVNTTKHYASLAFWRWIPLK